MKISKNYKGKVIIEKKMNISWLNAISNFRKINNSIGFAEDAQRVMIENWNEKVKNDQL